MSPDAGTYHASRQRAGSAEAPEVGAREGAAARDQRELSGTALCGDSQARPEDRGRRQGADLGREAGCAGSGTPKLVINCARSGKDRVKDFVIGFTSSPSTADERPVIRFLNLTGYPHRDSGAATGARLVRGTSSRLVPPRGSQGGSSPRTCTVAVDPPGAS